MNFILKLVIPFPTLSSQPYCNKVPHSHFPCCMWVQEPGEMVSEKENMLESGPACRQATLLSWGLDCVKIGLLGLKTELSWPIHSGTWDWTMQFWFALLCAKPSKQFSTWLLSPNSAFGQQSKPLPLSKVVSFLAAFPGVLKAVGNDYRLSDYFIRFISSHLKKQSKRWVLAEWEQEMGPSCIQTSSCPFW